MILEGKFVFCYAKDMLKLKISEKVMQGKELLKTIRLTVCKTLEETKNFSYLILQTMKLYPLMHSANWCATPLHIQLKNFLFMHR